MTLLLLVVLLLPLIAAVATVWVPPAARTGVATVAVAGAGAAAARLAAEVLTDGEVASLLLRGPAGVEVLLVVDGLAAAMLVTACVVWLLVGVHALFDDGPTTGHRHPGHGHRSHWPVWLALLAALTALFTAGDLLTAYLLLEVIGVAGAALVAFDGGPARLRAATRYLFAELTASALFLLGLALVFSTTGTLRFAELGAAPLTTSGALGLVAMTAGLLLKIPVVPVHVWLPRAHALAPVTVSPVLSGVVVTSALVILARLWLHALPEGIPTAATQVLGALGTVAAVWGALNALRTPTLKLLLAHSTLAQLGLLLLLVPLTSAGAVAGWVGGLTMGIAHALAKASMLLAATVLVADRGEEISTLTGVATRRPLAVQAFAISGVSLMGLPPTGGFVGKWYLVVASLETGQWWWGAVVVVAGLLTAAYVARVVKESFAPPAAQQPTVPVRRAGDVVALALAAGSLLLGLRPTELVRLLEVGAPVVGGGP